MICILPEGPHEIALVPEPGGWRFRVVASGRCAYVSSLFRSRAVCARAGRACFPEARPHRGRSAA